MFIGMLRGIGMLHLIDDSMDIDGAYNMMTRTCRSSPSWPTIFYKNHKFIKHYPEQSLEESLCSRSIPFALKINIDHFIDIKGVTMTLMLPPQSSRIYGAELGAGPTP